MGTREREINVQKSDYNVMNNEFDNMRERFETEMRRVEDEMNRLRREFEGYTPKVNNQTQSTTYYPNEGAAINNTGGRSSGYPSPGSSAVAAPQPPLQEQAVKPRYDPYLDNIKSPLIRDESDGKTLRLRFDVSQYRPEEVTVKTVDNQLQVRGKHEEKSAQRTVYREYNQEFLLPRGTNPEHITSSLSQDGILTVEAPLPPAAIEGSTGVDEPYHHRVPIAHR